MEYKYILSPNSVMRLDTIRMVTLKKGRVTGTIDGGEEVGVSWSADAEEVRSAVDELSLMLTPKELMERKKRA